MRKKHQKLVSFFGFIFAVLLISSCGSEDEVAESNEVAQVVQSAVNTIGGVGDDMSSGTEFSSASTSGSSSANAPTPVDIYATCDSQGRAVDKACPSGVKTVSYGGCTLGSSSAELSGSVTLTYSDDSNCDIAQSSENVERLVNDLTVDFSSGAQLVSTMASETNYEGASLGGATTLTTVTAGTGWTVNVSGHHFYFDLASGLRLFDTTVYTPTPVGITASLARGTREMDGGEIQIFHNNAEFTTSLQPNSVTWGDTSCCFPTSGSMSISLSGSRSGTGTVTFGSSCGSISIEIDGETSSASLSNCY
jgi:hypothetical protein